MSTLLKSDILNLSVAERILLVEDIWDSVAEIPESVELSESDKVELDERLALYHQDPEAGSPWGMVKERIKVNQALPHPQVSICGFLFG